MQPKVEELSYTIQEWLDWPRRSIAGAAGPSQAPGREKALRDAFRRNLEANLRAAVRSSITIARLLEIFTAASRGGGRSILDKTIAIYLGGQSDVFTTIHDDVERLLDESVKSGLVTRAESSKVANIVVDALRSTLSSSTAASSGPLSGATPEELFYHYLIPTAARRMHNVQVFLAFFGLIVIAIVIFAFIEPDPWLNPATAVFILFGYFTLIATSAMHSHSRTSSE
jgi:hypothetical protein